MESADILSRLQSLDTNKQTPPQTKATNAGDVFEQSNKKTSQIISNSKASQDEFKEAEKEYLKDMTNEYNRAEIEAIQSSEQSLRLIKANELTKNILPAKWLIKSIIPENGLIEIFGDSGSYKSFIVIDMLFRISSGLDYHGFKTNKGKVVYVAGEGATGVKQRLRALEIKHNIIDYDFYILPMPSNLFDYKEVIALQKDLIKIGQSDIIVFDTLHRNSSGADEDKAKDFAVILDNIDNYIFPLSKVVCWVHHTGTSDKDRARGTSSRYASVDTQIKVLKKADKYASIFCTKQKDAEAFTPLPFELETIEIDAVDDDGEVISTLYPKLSEHIADVKKSTLTTEQLALRDCLRAVIKSEQGKPLSDEIKEREYLTSGMMVEVAHWRNEAFKIIQSNGSDDSKKIIDAKRKAFTRAKAKLIEHNLIQEFNDFVWILDDCEKTIKPLHKYLEK